MNKDKIKVTLYIPHLATSLTNKLQAKRGALIELLKDTPFEKDTISIFMHLCKVKVMQHYSGANSESEISYLQKGLDLLNTLIVLHPSSNGVKLKAEGIVVDMPKTVIVSARNEAERLYNEEPYLFCDDDGIYHSPKDLNGLLERKRNIQHQIDNLRNERKNAGNPTYEKGNPKELSPAFRIKCAISIFAQCDGFSEWGNNAERNRIIFKGLNIMEIVDDEKETDNNRRKMVNDTLKYEFAYITPPDK